MIQSTIFGYLKGVRMFQGSNRNTTLSSSFHCLFPGSLRHASCCCRSNKNIDGQMDPLSDRWIEWPTPSTVPKGRLYADSQTSVGLTRSLAAFNRQHSAELLAKECHTCGDRCTDVQTWTMQIPDALLWDALCIRRIVRQIETKYCSNQSWLFLCPLEYKRRTLSSALQLCPLHVSCECVYKH